MTTVEILETMFESEQHMEAKSAEERKVYRRVKRCPHDEAVDDGNPDWPGLCCKKCGKKIPEGKEKYYI